MKNNLETEVKFYIPEPSGFRNRILSQNPLCKGRVFEKNILFDTPSQDLKKKGIVLRLRQDHGARLTVKTKTDIQDTEFKTLKEIETGVENFESASQALLILGFSHTTPYEKYRETFILGGVEVCLDEMPFGFFVELEGEKEEIRQTARALNLDWSHRITLSYRALFECLARYHGYLFPDITFSAFQNLCADIPGALSASIQTPKNLTSEHLADL